jgi:hypothetical protein
MPLNTAMRILDSNFRHGPPLETINVNKLFKLVLVAANELIEAEGFIDDDLDSIIESKLHGLSKPVERLAQDTRYLQMSQVWNLDGVPKNIHFEPTHILSEFKDVALNFYAKTDLFLLRKDLTLLGVRPLQAAFECLRETERRWNREALPFRNIINQSLTFLFIKTNKFDAALDCLSRSICNQKNWLDYFNFANLLASKGDLLNSLGLFEKAANSAPPCHQLKVFFSLIFLIF